jgi:hypothetical protein
MSLLMLCRRKKKSFWLEFAALDFATREEEMEVGNTEYRRIVSVSKMASG